MREFIRPVAAALSIACLAASMAVISSTDALAQAKPQMAPAQAAPQQPPPVKRKRGAEALEIVCAESWEHR